MKTIYKALIALAASFVLAPAASAQTVDPEKYEIKNGVGYNKYLVDTKPNANSEYTLRIETFLTGSIKETALPTDFVLVLDASGSMEYDYRPQSLAQPVNDAADPTTWSKMKDYIIPVVGTDDKFSRLAIQYSYARGALGANGSGGTPSVTDRNGSRSSYQNFYDEGKGAQLSSMYYHYQDPNKPSNDGYYRIMRRLFDGADDCLLDGPDTPSSNSTTAWKKYAGQEHTGTPVQLSGRPATVYYNLAIKLKDGTYKYLNGNGLSDTRYNGKGATGIATIMFINDGNLCRLQRRREALIDGVESFVKLVAEENAKDSQWDENIPARHQISIVRFSQDYETANTPSITPPTGYSLKTHVMNDFQEIKGETEALAFISDFEDKFIIGGETRTDFGMKLAEMLLQDLQTRDGGKYAALNKGGGPNRNKVVVFFTDGEPNHSGLDFFGTVSATLRNALPVKQVGLGKINGRIYSIDLAMAASTRMFLRHLSSNFPKGNTDITSGGWNNTSSPRHFTGSEVPLSEGDPTFTEAEYEYLKKDKAIFYKDSNDGDLKSVFTSIAEGNTGELAGQKLVMMDVMSDSFEIPANAGDKIKLYTAQCIGTKQIDGTDYLAFAEPIPAGSRPTVDHIWDYQKVGTGDDAYMTWVDLAKDISGGLVIDGALTASKTDDGKSITISGFDFASMWCGLDEDPDHYHTAAEGNTRHTVASDDPNAGYAADGYRGFKVIIEFPIIVSKGAQGGTGVPTNNKDESGFYRGTDSGAATGEPIINYQKPQLTIPVMLAVQKEGLGPNESASFTVQMKKIDGSEDWHDYMTFVLTCTEDDDKPIQKLINLNPDYYYRIKENNWSWAYSNKAQVEATFPSTDPEDPNYVSSNPIVIVNTPIPNPPKHAEAVSRNDMHNYSE